MKIIPFFLILYFMSGCNLVSNTKQAKFNIKLPEKKSGFNLKSIKSKSITKMSNAESAWGLLPQTNLDSSDCYAIYIQGSDLESGSCTSADGTGVLSMSQLYGLYSAGQTISLEIPAGDNRTVGVMAFVSADGSCTSATDPSFKPQNYSQPLLVGSKTQKLVSGDNEVIIQTSMNQSVPIESCNGKYLANLSGQVWPSCKINLSNVTYIDGQLKIAGECLANTLGASLINSTTSEKQDLSVVSKSQSSLVVKPLVSSASLASKTIYRLIINTAYGQVAEIPLTLNLDNVVTFPILKDSTGATLGDILPSGGMSGGNSFSLNTASGEVLNYFSLDGSYNTSTLYLVPGFYMISESINSTGKQLAQNGMLPYLQTWIGFSNSDCTGDVIIPVNSNKLKVKGNIVVQPRQCSYTTGINGSQIWSCAGWDYYKLTGQPTFQTNVTVNSTLNLGYGQEMASQGTFSYCYTGINTYTSSFVFTEAQKVPFASNDPAKIIQNAVLQTR